MAWQFSDETQQLLDRAQRAIDDSFRLREICARQLARALRYSFDLEDHLFLIERPESAGAPISQRGTETVSPS